MIIPLSLRWAGEGVGVGVGLGKSIRHQIRVSIVLRRLGERVALVLVLVHIGVEAGHAKGE
jgi:hypothetical protein